MVPTLDFASKLVNLTILRNRSFIRFCIDCKFYDLFISWFKTCLKFYLNIYLDILIMSISICRERSYSPPWEKSENFVEKTNCLEIISKLQMISVTDIRNRDTYANFPTAIKVVNQLLKNSIQHFSEFRYTLSNSCYLMI